MTKTAPVTVRLNESDNVVVARLALLPGTEIPEERVACRNPIPAGHKLATASIEQGEPIRKYGQIIGFATCSIEPGEHVHMHNMGSRDFARDRSVGTEVKQTQYVDEAARATFEGIVRSDGRIATRNYIGVLSTVNCSASVSRYIAGSFGRDELADYPNVTGVVALCHGSGCAMDPDGIGFEILQRTMAGYARHPNFAGVLIVGLGCETNQIERLLQDHQLATGPCLHTLTIQDCGGTASAVREGVERIRQMLPAADAVERRRVPASRLVLGLECAGSDAYSGITANPALGSAVDILVRHGGTAILGETPEIFGAEHLLTRRALSGEVADKIADLIRWWEGYTERHGANLDNNPSPGNKAGGLTTILEKSLGAIAKGGTTNLVDVYRHAEPVSANGLVFMDTPGYDAPSVAGMVAGGATLVCLTTGRGSVFGAKPVPVIKLASNTSLYCHMEGDMDVNCGTIVDGDETVDEVGERVFRLVLETASGKRTKSELLGIGDNEFVPWQIGAVM